MCCARVVHHSGCQYLHRLTSRESGRVLFDVDDDLRDADASNRIASHCEVPVIFLVSTVIAERARYDAFRLQA